MYMIKHPFSGRTGDEDRDIGFDYRRKVGNYIAKHRKEAGLTQLQLGKAVGMGANAISAIELGRNPVPPERYRSFADALGLNAKKFGVFLLEYTDPWLFAMIYGEERAARHNLQSIPDRIKPANEIYDE